MHVNLGQTNDGIADQGWFVRNLGWGRYPTNPAEAWHPISIQVQILHGQFSKNQNALIIFEILFFVGQLDGGSQTDVLSHNYIQVWRGASLSMLTRKYELCNVRDCHHPHNEIDTTELLLTSREWARVQIVKYISFDTFIIISIIYTNSSSHRECQQYLLYLAHSNLIDYDFNTLFSKPMRK